MSQNTLFDVDAPSSNTLAFQDFSNTTISSDVPMGRISPANTPSVGGGPTLYAAEQRMSNSLSGATQPGGFLNLDFYTGYFDVDTQTVLTRCYKTLIPTEDYVNQVLSGVPDLYGPFWVPTTVIFSLFLTSSLYHSIRAYLAGEAYTYDFTRLGAAVTLVYSYFLGLPLLLWAAIKYWAGSNERSPVEMVSLYGYASTVWILVSWLTLIPVTLLRVALVLAATGLSLAFLARNLYPVLSNAPNVSARILIVVVAILHLGLGMGLWFGFMAGGGGAFNAGKGVSGTPADAPIGGGLGEEDVTRFMW